MELPCVSPLDEELPVVRHGAEFLSLLASSRVVVVCGETGSGKTTKLPQLALSAGYGGNGRMIACTQPRRIAAASVASRVASELGGGVGGIVGFQHRYARKTSPETRIKFMTDGVLLAETRSDPLLGRYDLVIIDEAHERSLNIDFLLGLLKRISAKRDDLKIVVSSATMDAAAFSEFFGGAPVLSVPGRAHPVEIRYLPPEEGDDGDLPDEVLGALSSVPPAYDTLVFLPGEREIRDTAERIEGSGLFPRDEIIPLMASLGQGETERAFRLSTSRRIILSTNVAETSLTIPGIKCVIDSGLARISRYSHRTEVQRLQVERISQASANQRAGRAGRVSDGICIRLYTEEDFATREKWTRPEILRTSLAGVILAMLDLGLGDVESFPFIDPPKGAMVREGFRQLLELGAISRKARTGGMSLTSAGRALARIPLEPRLARMMLAASHYAVLPQAIPVIAFLGCEDPLRSPLDEREKARAAHAQFRCEGSDFLGVLRLWKWWDGLCAASSQSQLRKIAKKTYLSFRRMREWRDLAGQLEKISRSMGLDMENRGGDDAAFHKALLSGLVGRIGRYDAENGEYAGVHGSRFLPHPSSVLMSKSAAKGKIPRPEWIVAAELVDTSRLYAKTVASIDPEWILQVASNIVKRHWHSPFWDPESGFVRVYESVTLYSLKISDGRLRDFSRIDPEQSREIFILHALVNGEFPDPPPEVRRNSSLISDMRRRAAWRRDPSLFDEGALMERFRKTVPREICSAGALRKWLAAHPRTGFVLDRGEWLKDGADDVLFPSSVRIGNVKIALSYEHSGDESDGVTARVSKKDAGAIAIWRHDWLVPGLLPEKVNFMLLSLPSAQRRPLPPVQDAVSIAMPLLDPSAGRLSDELSRVLDRRFGVRVDPEFFERLGLPRHLQIRFVVTDGRGGEIVSTRNPREALSCAGMPDAASVPSGDGDGKSTEWVFGKFQPFSAKQPSAVPFRALFDEGDGVLVRLFKDRIEARVSHERGVARLMQLAISPKNARPALLAAVRAAAIAGRPDILSAEDFNERLAECRGEIFNLEREIAAMERTAEEKSRQISIAALSLSEETREDISVQLAWLVFPGFVKTVPYANLKSYPRFFKALETRISRARTNPSGDRNKMARIEPYWREYVDAATGGMGRVKDRTAFAAYRWMLEEYRISLFAQEQKTSYPASPERLSALWLKALGRA